METVVDLIDEELKDIYKINNLSSMRSLTRICSGLSKDIIEHCWKHTKICPSYAETQISLSAQASVCPSIDTKVARLEQ